MLIPASAEFNAAFGVAPASGAAINGVAWRFWSSEELNCKNPKLPCEGSGKSVAADELPRCAVCALSHHGYRFALYPATRCERGARQVFFDKLFQWRLA